LGCEVFGKSDWSHESGSDKNGRSKNVSHGSGEAIQAAFMIPFQKAELEVVFSILK
jgi:hypothetical protein